jgi:hypothetical protein
VLWLHRSAHLGAPPWPPLGLRQKGVPLTDRLQLGILGSSGRPAAGRPCSFWNRAGRESGEQCLARGRRDAEGEGPDHGRDDGFSADDFPGRELFASGDPMKILARLHPNDPLELWPRCAERISEQAVLLQPDRLYMRVVARLAYSGPAYRGEPPLDAWIGERMDVSLRELLSDDLEEERRELPTGLEQDPRYVFLSKTLGIEIGLAPRVCNRFNNLPIEHRAAFFGVLIQGRGIQGYATDQGVQPEQVKDLLLRAIRAIGIRKDVDLGRFEWGKGVLPEDDHGD